MTVGEKIQKYRKGLGLSQEELGQKLLVSRQTISLWENDQTVPSIDNLMRLREIFGISVDEILDMEIKEKSSEIEPNETYRFEFTKEELHEIGRLQRRKNSIKPILFALSCIYLAIIFIGISAPNLMIGLVFGVLSFGLVGYIKGILALRKAWKNSTEQICKSTYEYKLFENSLEVNIYRENEKIRQLKCRYTEIEKIHQFGKWLFLQFGGLWFIIRGSELKEDAALYAYVCKNSAKTTKKSLPIGWKVASIVLFVASILSLFVACVLFALVSDANKLSVENMWVFFLMTPIPIASIIFGFASKAKGHTYIKNIIVGFIIMAFLCLYGSFTFIFASMYDHSDTPIIRIEQMTGIDIPEHFQISTQDWTEGSQSVARGYIYSVSDVYFDDTAVEEFEQQLASDEKWLPSVPNALVGIISSMSNYGSYDYILIYNVDTSEFNTLPRESGTFRFINILYSSEDNKMQIIEYSIDYAK